MLHFSYNLLICKGLICDKGVDQIPQMCDYIIRDEGDENEYRENH